MRKIWRKVKHFFVGGGFKKATNKIKKALSKVDNGLVKAREVVTFTKAVLEDLQRIEPTLELIGVDLPMQYKKYFYEALKVLNYIDSNISQTPTIRDVMFLILEETKDKSEIEQKSKITDIAIVMLLEVFGKDEEGNYKLSLHEARLLVDTAISLIKK